MRWIAGLLVALAVAACAPLEQAPAQTASVEKPVPASTQSACVAQGGDWAPICRMQQPACVLSFSDAGKACTDSDQCQGNCYADLSQGPPDGRAVVGRCAVNSNPCGCNARVEDGKATPTLCVD
jgi:hypothetical protein